MTQRTLSDPIFFNEDINVESGSRITVYKRAFSPLPWYGSKARHISWLLPLLPQCQHYVEPFGGSAVVLLNREPSPVETYNDINGDVVNFFKVLRDQPDALITALNLTPVSREEFALSIYDTAELTPLERARRFCVRCQQSFGASGNIATLSFWSSSVAKTFRGMATSVSRVLGKQQSLAYTAQRLLTVQIEDRPAVDCIRRYDTPDTLFYCDPPYVHETRRKNYNYSNNEMSMEEHKELADLLNSVQGKVALSGYESDLYNDLFPPPKWTKLYDKRKGTSAAKNRSVRQEVLWVNYHKGLF